MSRLERSSKTQARKKNKPASKGEEMDGRFLTAELESMDIDALQSVQRETTDSPTRRRAKKMIKARGFTPAKAEPKIFRPRKERGRVYSDPFAKSAAASADVEEIAALLEKNGAERVASSESGSIYLKFRGRDVRVSDHPPTAATKNWLAQVEGISLMDGDFLIAMGLI